MSTPKIQSLSVGSFDNNVYILTCPVTGQRALIDPANEAEKLLAALKFSGPPPTGWLDRLTRRRAISRDASGSEAWREGLRMTLSRLDQVLLDRRVIAQRLEGQPFDPRAARIVATAADSAAPDGTVIEEVRAGFLWDDQVLRTAEVIVSKAATRTGESP